jgi:hypothetical protein
VSEYLHSHLRLITLCSLLRLRQELEKLVSKHCEKVVDPIARATALSNCYETLLQGLSVRLANGSYTVAGADDSIDSAARGRSHTPKHRAKSHGGRKGRKRHGGRLGGVIGRLSTVYCLPRVSGTTSCTAERVCSCYGVEPRIEN